MHAQKGGSEVPRTHHRACKISKFSGAKPPELPSPIYNMAPLHVLAQGPPILSAALITVAVKIKFSNWGSFTMWIVPFHILSMYHGHSFNKPFYSQPNYYQLFLLAADVLLTRQLVKHTQLSFTLYTLTYECVVITSVWWLLSYSTTR